MKLDEEVCTGCGACMEACPVDAISVHDGKARIDTATCIECGICENECPVGAISME